MSEKTRYFRIGLFTIFALVLLCIGLVIFGTGSVLQDPPLIAETYFDGSVQGLDVGALVKMNGVKIGKVKEILFVKDVYEKNLTAKDMGAEYGMVYVKLEIESKYFPRLKARGKEEVQGIINEMVKDSIFRAKLESIGITGLVYVELGFYDPRETPAPAKIPWTPKEIYIPSAPGVATRLGESLDKLLNKMDTDMYPMMENLSRASANFPALTANLNAMMPHMVTIARNVEDITSTAKKYPSSMIFGDAPPKSRYDR